MACSLHLRDARAVAVHLEDGAGGELPVARREGGAVDRDLDEVALRVVFVDITDPERGDEEDY